MYGTGNSGCFYISTNFNFTADSALTTVTFRDVSSTGNDVDLLLDNVQVSQTTSPPPTPVIGPFTNGSFESAYTGWTVTGNQQLSPRASQGSTALQFNPGQTTPNGVASQIFATTVGQTYALSFDVGADWGTPSTAQLLQVTVAGNSALLARTVTVYGPGNSSSSYLSTNFNFTADSTSTTLTFTDVSPTGWNIDLLLDNVQVSQTISPPPPPPPPTVGTFANGSFESGYSGWTVTGNQQISPRASQGSAALQFNPGQTSPNGIASQAFATTAGQAYALAFDVGADWGTPSTAQALQVTVTGNSTLLSRTVSVYGPGNSSSLYISTNFVFTADSACTTLTFADVSPTGFNIDLLLDNVQISKATSPPPPTVAPFTNGSFESGYTGWTVTGNQQLSPRASQGTTALQFNPGQTSPNGVVSQNFATIPGQTYALTFEVGTDWGTPSTAQALQVTVTGKSALLARTVTVYGPGNGSSLYVSTNFTFTADSTSATLTFKDVSATGWDIDLLLDNVQVAPAAGPLAARPDARTQPPVLTVVFSSDAVLIYGEGAAGELCEVQATWDLVTWTPLARAQLDGGKALLMTETREHCSARFYRLVVVSDLQRRMSIVPE